MEPSCTPVSRMPSPGSTWEAVRAARGISHSAFAGRGAVAYDSCLLVGGDSSALLLGLLCIYIYVDLGSLGCSDEPGSPYPQPESPL